MEKPNFEEKANQIVFYRWDTENDPDGTKANNFVEDYIEGCEHVWNIHVVPLQEWKDEATGKLIEVAQACSILESENKALREEIERLKAEVLKEKFPEN